MVFLLTLVLCEEDFRTDKNMLQLAVSQSQKVPTENTDGAVLELVA